MDLHHASGDFCSGGGCGGCHLQRSHGSIPVNASTYFLVATPPQPQADHVYHYLCIGWFPLQDISSDHSTIYHHQQMTIDLALLRSYNADHFLSATQEDTPSSFELVPFYYEQSDEIDWCRPRHSWNINQDYTYFNLFGCVAREDFNINQLLAKPEEFVDGDLFPHVRETFDNSKSGRGDKICVVCAKDEHKERIACLDCGHGYHVYCMEDWLHNWNICPLCKFDALG